THRAGAGAHRVPPAFTSRAAGKPARAAASAHSRRATGTGRIHLRGHRAHVPRRRSRWKRVENRAGGSVGGQDRRTGRRNSPMTELLMQTFRPKRTTRLFPAVIGLAWAAVMSAQQPPVVDRAVAKSALRIAGNMTTIELAPVLLAANGIYPGHITVVNGGIPNLVRGEVDAATNAETQLLRQSIDDPSLRVILTEAESFYRIVARRSASIASVKDLRGKKIAIAPYTSAHYYLVKSL